MADVTPYADIIRQANSGETVRDAIVSCVQEINADAAVKSKNLLITSSSNKTYRAGTGYAFKNVTVNIDNEGESDPNKSYNLQELEITNADIGEVHSYPDPPDDNLVYNKVTVNIDWDTMGSQFKLGEQATITGVLGPDESGLKYWDANLAGSGYDYVKRVYFDPSAGINLPDYPGNNSSGTGPFTVTFRDFNNKPVASVPDILYGHDAHEYMSSSVLTNIQKIESDDRFSGWAPSVSSVTSSFPASPSVVKRGAGGSLDEYTWDDILANQSKFGVGSTVSIISDEVTVPAMTIYGKAVVDKSGSPGHDALTMPEHTYPAGFIILRAMLVAHGEGSTNSTWIATTPIGKSLEQFRQAAGGYLDGIYGMRGESTGCDDMTSSIEYQFLSAYLSYFFPEPIRSALMQDKTKAQWGFGSYTYSINDVRYGENAADLFTLQRGGKAGKIWLPSMSELRSWAQTAVSDVGDAYNDVEGSDSEWHRITNPIYTCKSMDPHVVNFNEGSPPNDYSKIWRPSNAAYTQLDGYFVMATRTTLRARWHQNAYVGPAANGLNLKENHHDKPIFSALNTYFQSNWYIGFNT